MVYCLRHYSRNATSFYISCCCVIYKLCFAQKYNNTNIIIVNIPHRHDLDRTSEINTKIRAFNRLILKVAKAYNHITIVDTDLDRKLFTRHGMHLID